jgi:hypothetical protein
LSEIVIDFTGDSDFFKSFSFLFFSTDFLNKTSDYVRKRETFFCLVIVWQIAAESSTGQSVENKKNELSEFTSTTGP